MFALLHSRRAWRPPLTALLLSILTASPVTLAAGTMSGERLIRRHRLNAAINVDRIFKRPFSLSRTISLRRRVVNHTCGA